MVVDTRRAWSGRCVTEEVGYGWGTGRAGWAALARAWNDGEAPLLSSPSPRPCDQDDSPDPFRHADE